MNLRPYQNDAITGIQQKFKENKRKIVLCVLVGGGKCLGKDTPILMYNWTKKMVQDVQVGDLLMGDDLTPRKVLSLARGREEMWRVVQHKKLPYFSPPSDNFISEYICNKSHILSLYDSVKDSYIDMSISEIENIIKEQSICSSDIVGNIINLNRLKGYNINGSTHYIQLQRLKEDDYYGFEIDGNRRFCLGDGTVTHNTVIASKMIQMAVYNKKRILFIAHRSELIKQCHEKLKQFGIDAGIIMAGYKEDRTKKVQVASIQTLARRSKPLADLVIIDECHNSISPGYLKVLREYESSDSFFVGLSATPFRTNKKQGLDTFYEDFVYPVKPSKLIEYGFIVPTKVYACARIITNTIKKKNGDFDDKELMVAFDKENVYLNLITNMSAYVKHKKFIAFCCNVEHSKKTAEELNRNGFTCKHVVGTFSKEERDRIVEEFKEGKFQGLTNVNIFTEGTDLPSVEAIILNSATTSKIKHIQSIGRGMRSFPNKTHCIVLDMADNTKRLGFAEDEFEISLEPQKTKEKKGVTPIRDCPECGFIMKVQARVCPECGNEMVFKKTKQEIEDEIFVELDKQKLKVQPYLSLPKDRWNEIPTDLLEAFAKEKGYKKGWANHIKLERGEGKKKIKILNYDEADYHKQCAIIRKGYFDKAYPIDAHVWQFVEETDKEVIFEYKLKQRESVL